MSADAEFARDPYAFMQTNIVIPCVPSGDPLADWGVDDDGCVKVYVREDTRSKQGNKGGKVHKLWLAKNKTGVATVKIYWCTYNNNTSPPKMLGPSAGYMFTAGMNMCTLGVGSQIGSGHCLVSHANAVGDQLEKSAGGVAGGQVAQIMRQDEQLAQVFGDSDSDLTATISPDRYMVDGANAY